MQVHRCRCTMHFRRVFACILPLVFWVLFCAISRATRNNFDVLLFVSQKIYQTQVHLTVSLPLPWGWACYRINCVSSWFSRWMRTLVFIEGNSVYCNRIIVSQTLLNASIFRYNTSEQFCHIFAETERVPSQSYSTENNQDAIITI